MKLTGHKTESVYRRYAIVSEGDLAQGVAKLALLHEAPAPEGRVIDLTGRTRQVVGKSGDNSGRRLMPSPWTLVKDQCRGRESNPHTSCDVANFKSGARGETTGLHRS